MDFIHWTGINGLSLTQTGFSDHHHSECEVLLTYLIFNAIRHIREGLLELGVHTGVQIVVAAFLLQIFGQILVVQIVHHVPCLHILWLLCNFRFLFSRRYWIG